MTVKEFFKSKAFKCIVVLMSILLVCGIFLTIMNGFLEVSAEERFARAIKKIYGHDVETVEIDNLKDYTATSKYSEVLKAYMVTEDGDYLVNVKGKEGFGGSVTCWIVVEMSDDGSEIEGIYKIVIDKAPGESYISKISQSRLDELAAKAKYGEELLGGFIHNSTTKHDEEGYVKTGASYSMRAISNAVNGAMNFVADYLEKTQGGTENE